MNRVPETLHYMCYGFFTAEEYDAYQLLVEQDRAEKLELLDVFHETADGHIWLEQQKHNLTLVRGGKK